MNPCPFPNVQEKIGLGVGMDLQWQSKHGFHEHPDRLAQSTHRFIERYKEIFNCLFFSFQPKNNNRLNLSDYQNAYDDLISSCEGIKHTSLHHTRLNMASGVPYHKEELIDFTNDLIKRYQLDWINEDLGFWSLLGKNLPYPLPPLLSEQGLQACIDNIKAYQADLKVPLLVEFPSFAEGSAFFPGHFDPLVYFYRAVQESQSPCTLDTAHILSLQWFKGFWGSNILQDLDKLPLQHCFEVHLSGCAIENGKFMDYHHGVLLDEQLQLLEYLMENCPNLKVITYEDPVYDDQGVLEANTIQNFNKLETMVKRWIS